MNKISRILLHPFSGFEDMKYNNDSSPLLASLAVLMFFIASVAERQYTAFRFNYYDVSSTNIIYIFISSVVLVLFFVLANWSITTLVDGKGTLPQIFAVMGYSLIPYISALLLTTVLSHIFIADEGMFLSIIKTAGILYTVLLIFAGMMEIHRLSAPKTVFCLIISVVGVFLIMFLCFLLYTLFQQILSFFGSVIDEIMLRMN